MSLTSQNILVLGASGALGSQLASGLAAQGARVIGTAQSESSLSKIPASIDGKHVVDLTDSSSIENLVHEIKSSVDSLDGVVIATGVVGFAPIESVDSKLAVKMMAINTQGPMQVVSGLFELLKNHASEKAFVLGLSGVVVEQNFPGMSTYTASKTALSAFLQSVEKEWRRYKIRSIDVHLGHTETGLATRPLFGDAPQMPTGHSTEHAVQVIINAINSDTRVLASTDF